MRKSVQLIHAAGLGMSGLAHVLLDNGWRVFGWDDAIYPRLRALMSRGLILCDPMPIPGVEYVVYSKMTSSRTLARFAASRALGLYKFLPMLAPQTVPIRSVVVSGSVGKSWTAWLIAELLQAQGFMPTVLAGAERSCDGRTGIGGDGGMLIVEVPEEELPLTSFFPTDSVITAIDNDERLDRYRALVANTSYRVYVPLGLPDYLRSYSPKIIEVGSVTNLELNNPVLYRGSGLAPEMVRIARLSSQTFPATAVCQDALLAFAVARDLGVSDEAAAYAIERFHSPRHRLERSPVVPGLVTFISDVAHRPHSVQVALTVARSLASGSLVVFYEPSTASEVRADSSPLLEALKTADFVGLLDVRSNANTSAAGGAIQAVVESLLKKSADRQWFYAGSSRAGSLTMPHLDLRFPCVIACLGMYIDDAFVEKVKQLVQAVTCYSGPSS